MNLNNPISIGGTVGYSVAVGSAIVAANQKKKEEMASKPHPVSSIVKWMMQNSNVSIDVVAEYLGISTQALRNKFSRDTFSINDLYIIAFACNAEIQFIGNKVDDSSDKEAIPAYTIPTKDYIDQMEKGEKERVLSVDKGIKKKKKEEYEQLKKQLAEMEAKYGFK